MFKNLLDEMELPTDKDDYLMPLFCDNTSALDISEDGLRKSPKHYDLSLLYVMDYVKRNEVHLEKVKRTKT